MVNSQLTYAMIEEMEELVQEVDTQIKALENHYSNKLFLYIDTKFLKTVRQACVQMKKIFT